MRNNKYRNGQNRNEAHFMKEISIKQHQKSVLNLENQLLQSSLTEKIHDLAHQLKQNNQKDHSKVRNILSQQDFNNTFKLIQTLIQPYLPLIQPTDSPEHSQINFSIDKVTPKPQEQNAEDSFQVLSADQNQIITTPKNSPQIPIHQGKILSQLPKILDQLILLNTIIYSQKVTPLLYLKQFQKPSPLRNHDNRTKSQSFNQSQQNIKKDQQREERITENQLQFQDVSLQIEKLNIKESPRSESNKDKQSINEKFQQLHSQKKSLNDFTLLLKHNNEVQKRDQRHQQAINELIEYYVKFLIHFNQFILEISLELSTGNNGFLANTYNVVRYLIANLIIHFRNQISVKIKAEIKKSLNSEQVWKNFQSKLKQSQRIKDSEKKLSLIQSITFSKIQEYLERLKKQQKNKQIGMARTNITKIKEIIIQRPQLIQMVKDLNTDYLIDKEYSFEKIMKIYTQVVCLARQEFLNEKFMEGCFKKLAKSHKIREINLSRFLQEMCEGSFGDENRKNLFDKTLILIMQQVKVSNFILCLPYYTFANQLQNVDRKFLNKKEIDIKLSLSELRKQENHEQLRGKMQQKSKKNMENGCIQLILRNMDGFYIMKGKRVNRKYWEERLRMDEFEFYEDVENYVAFHQHMLRFHTRSGQQVTKEKVQQINKCLTLRQYQEQGIKTIHYGKFSLFDTKEQESIRNLIQQTVQPNQQYKSPFSPKLHIVNQLNKVMESFFSDI